MRIAVLMAGLAVVAAAQVRVGATDRGLVVEGRHKALWISLADAVKMPEVGWGVTPNGGFLSCDIYDDENPALEKGTREKCEAWVAAQEAYREKLQRLFARGW